MFQLSNTKQLCMRMFTAVSLFFIVTVTQASDIVSNKAVVTEYLEALGTDKFEEVSIKHQADNFILARDEFAILKHNAEDPNLKTVSQDIHIAISDRNNEVTRVLAQDNRVAATYKFTGKHTGNLYGIAATDKTLEIVGTAMFVMSDEGKIEESWLLGGEAGILRQLNAKLPERADGKLNLPPIVDNSRTYDEALAEHLASPEDTPEWWHTRLLLSYKAKPENRPDDYKFEGRPYSNLLRGGIDVIKYRGEALGVEGGHGKSMSGRRDMIVDTVAEGDLAMMRFRLKATNDGPLYGIPPGGGQLNDWEVGFAHFEGNEWVDAWWLKDELGFLLSIGTPEAFTFLVDE